MRLLLVLALGAPACAQEIYDLLLKNGTVIDPANRRSGRMDVAVTGGRIARVAPDLPASQARVVVDAGQYYVTPGLIDIHVHFNATAGDFNLQPDHNSLPYGVTTAVDAGGSGWKTFEAFQHSVIRRARTRVLALLNTREMDPEAAAGMIAKHRDTIVGIALGRGEAPTEEAVDLAAKAARLSGTIVMAEGGEEVARRLRPGDIQTHAYGSGISQLDAEGKIAPWLWEARTRGVLFDVGHGSGGFWFRIAGPAIRQGFLPDTISTGMDKESVMLPRATMTNVMSKFLNLGMSVEQLVERTTVNAARAIRRTDLGALTEGAAADIALLEVQKGSFGFLDSGHGKLTGDKRLRCVLTVRDGAIAWDSEGLAATDWIKAGPYSNYK